MTDDKGDRRQLGRILLKQRLVTAKQLDDMLQAQREQPGQRLASVAAAAGTVAQVDLLRALSEQHGLPGIDLSQVVIDLGHVREVPEELARRCQLLPIMIRDDRLFLAMADPFDTRVVEEVEFVTGKKVFPYVALHEALSTTIEAAYAELAAGRSHYIGAAAPPDYVASLGARREPQPGVDGVVSAESEITETGLSTASLSTDVGPALDASYVGPVDDLIADSTKRTILVVDDDEEIRRLLRRAFEERGLRVVDAGDGIDALHAVKQHSPDALVLDAMLPGLHGFDICRRIRGSQRYGHIPIVLMTAVYRGWRIAEDLRDVYKVATVLEKPFRLDDAIKAVEAALSGASQEPPPDEEALSGEANAALEKGLAAFQRGEIEAAVEHVRGGVKIDPLAFQLHYSLGLFLARTEEGLYSAIQAIETAVELRPRNYAALRNLAVLYQQGGFRRKAVEMWERALQCAPDADTRKGIKEHLVTLL